MQISASQGSLMQLLVRLTGATEYLLMPANGVFALGVGPHPPENS